MIKMAAMPIDGKKCLKIFSRTRGLIIFKLGFEHQGLGVYKVCINYDPWLNLTNLIAMANLQNLLFVLFLGPHNYTQQKKKVYSF